MKSMFLANEPRNPHADECHHRLSHLALKTQLTPKQRDYVSKVHNAGTSLLAIINDILDFSKIEAGKLDLETTDFKLDEVITSSPRSPRRRRMRRAWNFWRTPRQVFPSVARRSAAAGADSHELRQQRRQVYWRRARSGWRSNNSNAPAKRCVEILRARHRHRYDEGTIGEVVSAVHAGRHVHHAQSTAARAWALTICRRLRTDGRAHLAR